MHTLSAGDMCPVRGLGQRSWIWEADPRASSRMFYFWQCQLMLQVSVDARERWPIYFIPERLLQLKTSASLVCPGPRSSCQFLNYDLSSTSIYAVVNRSEPREEHDEPEDQEELPHRRARHPQLQQIACDSACTDADWCSQYGISYLVSYNHQVACQDFMPLLQMVKGNIICLLIYYVS